MRALLLLPWLVLAQSSVLAQTTLNMSRDLVRLGIFSSNMVPNQATQDAARPFFAAVQYAKSNQIAQLIADPGSYYFLSTSDGYAHITLSQVSNITIDFQGSDLY